jgi:hypothetical protein
MGGEPARSEYPATEPVVVTLFSFLLINMAKIPELVNC